MKDIKSLVITGFGINCERELAAAYQLAGAKADIVHLNDIFLGKTNIEDYRILNFPGGFSFGDDLGSGKVLANKMKYKKMADGTPFFEALKKYIARGNFILGVCNGFQFLVKMGLLPNTKGNFEQEVTLTSNDSGKFENRWVHCLVNNKSQTPFLNGINRIELPVRHGEGKLITASEDIKKFILEHDLNCLTYSDPDGISASEYPENPNGSELNCAGLTDLTGQIFGLMPHPEAFLSLYNHPDWTRKKRLNASISEKGEGFYLFENIIEYLKKEN